MALRPQTWLPVAASIGAALVTANAVAGLCRTELPSSTVYRTPNSRPTCFTSTAMPCFR